MGDSLCGYTVLMSYFHCTAVNAKPGDEGLRLPPSDGRYCDGVIERFREGTSP